MTRGRRSAAFYDRDALDGRARAAQQGARRGTGRGAARRGRGVPRCRRSRQPRVPGRDAAQRDDVRPPGHAVRVLLLRDALVRERGVRSRATPHAVLLRAAAPLAGLDVMRERRAKARRDRDLARGPGSLGQAFGFDRSFDGVDLTAARCASSTTARRRPPSPACPCASGSARARATRCRTGSSCPAIRT